MLSGWGVAQGILWCFDITALRDGLVLDGVGVRASEYWRFFTYHLLHANALHFLGTGAVLYFAGREVEPIIGRRHLIGMFLTATLVGGAASWAVAPEVGVYGASAAAAAVLTAYATILPELDHRVRLFIVWAVNLRARHMVILMLILAAFCVQARLCGAIGPAGILIGAVVGWFWARLLGFGRLLWFQRARHERDAIERRRERMSPEEFISAEIDPILEKIAREGLRSLTRAERRLLERAKSKMESKRE
jgi:membrane associated rhomboid family serine protease